MSIHKAMLNPAKRDDWGTPQWLFDKYDAEFNFTVDVCANNRNAKCKKYFDVNSDGLNQTWSNEVCWMNPPYGRKISQWIEKAHNEKALTVALLPARTDTKWFHDFCKFRPIEFISGRLYFDDGKERAPFPSMVVVFDNILGPALSEYEADK